MFLHIFLVICLLTGFSFVNCVPCENAYDSNVIIFYYNIHANFYEFKGILRDKISLISSELRIHCNLCGENLQLPRFFLSMHILKLQLVTNYNPNDVFFHRSRSRRNFQYPSNVQDWIPIDIQRSTSYCVMK